MGGGGPATRRRGTIYTHFFVHMYVMFCIVAGFSQVIIVFCLGFHSIVALLLLDRGSAENITIESVDYTSTVSCTRNPF